MKLLIIYMIILIIKKIMKDYDIDIKEFNPKYSELKKYMKYLRAKKPSTI